jgi:protein-S-isoprenylcysteine O-methyltransferase Ste14
MVPVIFQEMLPMIIIVLQMLGWLVFLAGTIVLGTWLHRNPGKRRAERTSRVLHFLFWMGAYPPGLLGVFYPGLASFDRELGLSPLPEEPVVRLIGAVGLLLGAYLIFASNMALRRLGQGANAFFLTKRLVVENLYERMRNPMSLGLYVGSAGIGLLAGSTYFTLGTVFAVVPVHIFYLKYFEEYELELRLGQTYLEYKQRVPFLLPRWFPGKN